MKRIMIALAVLIVATAAQARPHHHHHHHHRHYGYHHHHRVAPYASGRPHAWCGWYARQLVRQDPGPAYNLARNWARWGRPSSPGVGVMVVWSHHVGMITGRDASGNWIVKSGNDGRRVRERPRSVAGAIAFRSAS